jgi:hypothetical protein
MVDIGRGSNFDMILLAFSNCRIFDSRFSFCLSYR